MDAEDLRLAVYRAFADISSFEDEVRRLIERASQSNSSSNEVAVSAPPGSAGR